MHISQLHKHKEQNYHDTHCEHRATNHRVMKKFHQLMYIYSDSQKHNFMLHFDPYNKSEFP